MFVNSLVHHSPKLETTQMLIRKGMGKQIIHRRTMEYHTTVKRVHHGHMQKHR